MAVAATEQLHQLTTFNPPIRLVEAVPEMAEDVMTRFRAAKFIGACLANQQIEIQYSEESLEIQPIESLHDAIQKAAKGGPIAYKMVETNARTDVIERTIKAGHVIKVDLMVDASGKIQQHGQSLESVQANSLRLAADTWQMRERTEAEATNSFRIEQFHRQGKLDEYSFVVFSRAADNMTEQQMTDAGFFVDTMSCAIQVTTVSNGQLSTESAFVAGVKRPGDERHDSNTVIATAEKLGISLHGKNAAETINTPIIIHNSLIPNGVIDLVKLYDDINNTFFGEAKPRQNYEEYLVKCQEREAMLQPKVDAIVAELIGEAPNIKDRLTAVKRLHKISEKHMVEQAVFDHSINPLVFGPTSAEHIIHARLEFELGDISDGFIALKKAIDTADSHSCPSLLKKTFELKDDLFENEKSDDSTCEFVSEECPVCHKKNVKTTVTKKVISGVAKKIISGDCGCSVSK